MIFSINSKDEINYNPQNEIEDVVRNVHMILRVTKEEQPLMRDFSLDSDVVDKNIPVIKNKLIGLLMTNLKKYEPRALLKNLDLKLENNDLEIMLEIEVIV
jgi:hypothetical protein|nr:MAG TPA: Putative type VI secretion protein, baseplate, complex, STRUCTURAL PROTEIN.7A [Caudoviricetes sp.]DAX72277.1 MAG TPA: Putative type VI secretion protein, baseplate, complex, STRUCTURAL PROTEIN.7A [Caudoviricetes sp.]